MKNITGKIVGDIHVKVYKTSEGKDLFYLEADNKNVLPVLNFLENKLNNY